MKLMSEFDYGTISRPSPALPTKGNSGNIQDLSTYLDNKITTADFKGNLDLDSINNIIKSQVEASEARIMTKLEELNALLYEVSLPMLNGGQKSTTITEDDEDD